MNPKAFLVAMAMTAVIGLMVAAHRENAIAGEMGAAGPEVTAAQDYKVLEPIRHGNLTVFPVVAARSYDTGEFLTLDEGLRSSEVVVTESGNVRGLIRRHPPGGVITPAHDGAQVNKLVLVNNSKRPLLLLAGEIVTGGKQDRVISKDRIVPAESDPIDFDVFCVEPGRWVGSSSKFMNSMSAGVMAAPSVRGKAMADKSQEKVWAEVGHANEQMTVEVQADAAPSVSRDMGAASWPAPLASVSTGCPASATACARRSESAGEHCTEAFSEITRQSAAIPRTSAISACCACKRC